MPAIRLTVHPGEDVLLPAGVPLDTVREPLADLLRRPELRHATLWADGVEVAAGSVVGERPLLPGATVRADDGVRRGGDPAFSRGARGGDPAFSRGARGGDPAFSLRRGADRRFLRGARGVDPAFSRGERGGVAGAWSDGEALRSPWLVARTTGPEAGELAGLGPGTWLDLPGGVRVRVTGRGVVRVTGRWWASDAGTRDARRRAGRPRRPRAGRPPRATLIRPGRARPRRVGPWGRRWRPGDVLDAGARYTLHRSGDAAALLDVLRDAALRGGLRDTALPAQRADRGTGLAALLATALVPAAGSIGLAIALRQPTFALFAALGLVTAIPQLLAALRRRREAPASAPVTEPHPRPGVRAPDVLARAVLGAVHASEPSWRDALRVGARPRSPFPVVAGDTGAAERRRFLPDGAVAVRGPDLAAAAVARAVVAGLVAQGARVRVIGAGRDRWAWCRWLDDRTGAADRSPSAALEDEADVVVADGWSSAAQEGGAAVLVADGPSPAALDAAQAAHRAGADVVLCLPRGAVVPSWCRWVLDVVETPQGVTQVRHAQPDGGTAIGPLVGVSDTWAERFARRLAGVRALGRDVGALWSSTYSATRGTDRPAGADPTNPRLPAVVPLAGIVDVPASAWAVPLGVGADGRVVTFDLVDDGPHLLVAGTTGAGKSELLQALVLALALRRTPTDLALALIDFKGGASFGACADLPHVVGQVTDLDPGLAARALDGLRAELRRRKEVLATHGVADVVALPRGTLPRLVVVVDEFRALADDLPDLLPGLLRVAAQGRSLGVHLVLATQRPAGAVSADVRANVSARIALRVVDAADSHDVLDSAAAAHIPAGVPGRAVLRVGAQTPVALQCAYAGAAPAPATAAVRRAPAWSDTDALRRPAGAREASGPENGGAGAGSGREATGTVAIGPAYPGNGDEASSFVATLVDRARAAATQHATPRWPAPWLPPLPHVVQVREVAPVPRGALPLALGDSPSTQSRVPVAWDPTAGHLAILGRTRTGRSTTLRTLARAALDRGWHVHALVPASAVAQLEDLTSHPCFGTLAGPADPRRAARLLRLLQATVPEASAPVLVLVDGLEELRSALASPVDDPLGSALATGAAAFAVTAESAALGGLSARFGPRLVLLSADAPADAMLGAPSRWAGRGHAPGRAVWLAGADPLECQVALPGVASAPAEGVAVDPGDARALGGTDRLREPGPARLTDATDATRDHGDTGQAPRRAPIRVLPLPRHVDHDALLREAPAAIGIGGDGAVPVAMPTSRGALVVGPRGSGRTTALRVLLRSLSPGDPSVVIARDRDLTADAARRGAQVEPPTPAALRAVLDALDTLDTPAGSGRGGRGTAPHPRAPQLLLIDDADALAQAAPLETDVLAQRAADGLVAVVASATTLAAGIAHRGLLAQLRAARTGIVLSPAERGAEEVFATALDDAVEPGVRLPGRGAIVVDGVVGAVQLATPSSTGGTGAVSAAWSPRPRAA